MKRRQRKERERPLDRQDKETSEKIEELHDRNRRHETVKGSAC